MLELGVLTNGTGTPCGAKGQNGVFHFTTGNFSIKTCINHVDWFRVVTLFKLKSKKFVLGRFKKNCIYDVFSKAPPTGLGVFKRWFYFADLWSRY